MKYHRNIISAIIALAVMLTPLPCFGETDVLQYTADPTNAESWQNCDPNQSGSFEQGKKYTCAFPRPNQLNPAPLRRKAPTPHRFSGSVPPIRLRKSSFSRIRKVSIF
nr:hypothetical protein [uncultured Mogibacterium sp.]